MVTKRSVSGRTKYEKTKLSTFLEHYGSEEWLLQQLLTMEFLEKVKVNMYYTIFGIRIGISRATNRLQAEMAATSSFLNQSITLKSFVWAWSGQ